MVVVSGMDALYGLRQQWDDVAIVTDVVVVATLTEFGFTTGDEVLDTEGAVASVCHAVDND